MARFDTATGTLARHVLPGAEYDELLTLVRLGIRFKRQQRGRRPGFLRRYITGTVSGMPEPVTFEALLSELDLAAARRATSDGRNEPIERVSRTWEEIVYHDPRRGRQQIAFSSLRKHLTKAKKAVTA